jgi:DUF4097 and DUF4098 domain-containing protein YvlB
MRVITNRFQGVALGLAVLAGLGVGITGVARRADAEELKRVAERLIPFESGGSVHIDDKNGKVVVEGWPRREVRIQITRVVRFDDRAKAEELMKDLQADVEVRKDRIDIDSRFPKLRETVGLLNLLKHHGATLQINYYVQVPQETDLMLQTSNGEVRVQGTTGRLEAKTTNGDIDVSQVKGRVGVTTTNGEVHLTDVSGQAFARTTNGSVVAEIRHLPPQGVVQLETTNGNVEGYFDSDLKADLEATTTNGRVSVAFPITSQGVTTSRTIRGTIQGGGAKISIQTTNGNVEVRRLGDRRP